MRCRNCGSKARPGRYCSGCGMLQPPRVAKGLKAAVGILGVLAIVLLSAVGYVLLKLEPQRRAVNAPPAMLAELRDASGAPAREPSGTAQETQQDEVPETAAQPDAPELQSAGPETAQTPAEEQDTPEAAADGTQTVDDEVKAIRAEFNAIEENRQAGRYEKLALRQSVSAWMDGSEPACIVLHSGADGLDFERSYYFEDGMLRFALLEADDACRLYFKDDVLLRLRYAEDARKASDSVDYDGSGGTEYGAWREFALSEAYTLYADACQAAAAQSGYVLPGSDSRYLREDDLRGLTAEECRLARNEIFARHGRRFEDPALQAYFDACSWYTGTVAAEDFDESVFNEYEAANVAFIREYETAMGYR